MADWSALQCDVLGDIVLRLDAIEDLVRFEAVCRSWKFACLQVKHLSQPSSPWLMLAESTEENPECLRKFFSLHSNRCFQLKLPETFGRRCWGSNYGWIVTTGLDRELHLFNPLTRNRICLPHQSTLPHQPTTRCAEWYRDFRRMFVRRAIVIRKNNEFLVMIVFGEYYCLAFARPGDRVWIPLADARNVEDVCYCYGKILVIFYGGAIGCYDLNSPNAKVIDCLPPPPRILTDDGVTELYKLYLVNSFGNLLIVVRFKEEIWYENDPKKLCYQTVRFIVFKPDFNTKKWVKVDDLEDIVLFVGDNSSISIAEAGKYRRNHVYFTDDEYIFWEWPREGGGHDMGAYNMENDEAIPYYEGGDFRSRFCTPLWFIPRF